MSKMVKCRLAQRDEGFGYHLYVNDVDVAPYVTGFTISCSGPEHPSLTLDIPLSEFQSDVMVELGVNYANR